MLYLERDRKGMAKDIFILANLGVQLLDYEDGSIVIPKQTESYLEAAVQEKENDDPIFLQLRDGIHQHGMMAFVQRGDGTMICQGKLGVLNVCEKYKKNIIELCQNIIT